MNKTTYKLLGHNRCNAHVDLYRDKNGMIDKLEFWSDRTMVVSFTLVREFAYNDKHEYAFTGKYKWVIKCTGSFSVTTARQITWFTRQPHMSDCKNWLLSRQLMMRIFKRDFHIKDANEQETDNIKDLILSYLMCGNKCRIHG